MSKILPLVLVVVLGAVMLNVIDYLTGVDLRDHYTFWQRMIHNVGILFWGGMLVKVM